MRHPYIELRKLGLQVENVNSYFLQNIRRCSNCILCSSNCARVIGQNKDFFGGVFKLTWDNTWNGTFCKSSI
jgi:succinate dehydrogenase/fumarate reductase-like Fe-S protein